MKTLTVLLFITFSLLCHIAFCQTDITGRWVAPGEKGSGFVEVFVGNDGKYHGRFVQASDPDQDRQIRDRMRQDGKKEILILENLSYTGNNTWGKGTVLSVSRQTKFGCKLKLKDPTHLIVTGYYGLSFLSKSFTWYRE